MDPTNLREDFVAEVEHLTTEIAAMLALYPAQAEVMRHLGDAARLRPETLGTLYRDGAIWGGSGSWATATRRFDLLDHLAIIQRTLAGAILTRLARIDRVIGIAPARAAKAR